MRLIGICLVKNEEDIVEWSLNANAKWFDHILVIDNQSTDNTWRVVCDLATKQPRVKPVEQTRRAFRDGLRSIAFNNFRHLAQRGDWWCRLDGDEVYPDDPRDILQNVSVFHHVVWSQHLNFYLTKDDLPRLQAIDEEKNIPKFDSTYYPTHYACNFTEPRFFRHRRRLKWTEEMSWPRFMGVESPKLVPVHHLQYRTPQQIEKRLSTRREATRNGYLHFNKDTRPETWRDKLFNAKELEKFYSGKNIPAQKRKKPLSITRFLKIIGHTSRVLP